MSYAEKESLVADSGRNRFNRAYLKPIGLLLPSFKPSIVFFLFIVIHLFNGKLVPRTSPIGLEDKIIWYRHGRSGLRIGFGPVSFGSGSFGS